VTAWPADAVERRAVENLVPYARNARTHSERQVEQLAASIQEWGWTTPVLVAEDGTIIAGHGRVLAAQSLGIGEVPVMIARGWTEAQKRAYVLADNQLATIAGWDEDLLRFELQDLAGEFDMALLGFDAPQAVESDGLESAGYRRRPAFFASAILSQGDHRDGLAGGCR
jgi:ParB-like chromosome segregation protein Spo0J